MRRSLLARTFLCCGAIAVKTVEINGIKTIVPIFPTAGALASGNGLPFGALEALQSRGALRITVAFSRASFQVFGLLVVLAAQCR